MDVTRTDNTQESLCKLLLTFRFETGKNMKRLEFLLRIYTQKRSGHYFFDTEIAVKPKTIPKKQMATEINQQ